MFLGVIPDGFRRILKSYSPNFGDEIFVLCSGNFTSESVLSLNGYKGKINSCDVSIYTCAVGAYLTDKPFKVKVVDPDNEVPFISKYISNEQEIVCSIMLLSDMSIHAKGNNDFQKRMFQGMVDGWDILFEKTMVKLDDAKARLKIDNFFAEDAMTVLDRIPTDATIMTYVPTWDGGYEKMFNWNNKIMSWDAPKYQELTSSEPFYKKIVNGGYGWYVYAEHELHEDFAFLGKPKSTLEKTSFNINLYTNSEKDKNYYVGWHGTKMADKLPYKILRDEEITIDSKIDLQLVEGKYVDYFRLLFMQKGIQFQGKGNMFPFMVFVDEKLVGVVICTPPDGKLAFQKDKAHIYLLADTALPNKKYPRLGKLILYATLSTELKNIVDKRLVNDHGYIVTTAFSNHPKSMKYRGCYKLHSRKETPEKDRNYMLNYIAETGKWSLKKGYQMWYKRHCQK